ncbi:MAG: MarC family protein [Crocinitomicaceae bacterium]|nr:MarC family protein [Crocinitomicaceae bacterium]
MLELLDITEIFKATMVLFAVIDIIGSIPIIIKVKEKTGDIHPLRISIVSLLIMLGFLVGGKQLLGLFGVNIESFAVAGSIILFALAFEMILNVELFKEDKSSSGKTASIVPLAFPIIAGAGSMTTLISLRAVYEMPNIIVALLINMLFVYVVLKLTRRIERLLGPGGIAIVKKVFGIILLAIAIKLFAANVTHIL